MIRLERALAGVLFFVSGATSLVYEVVWMRALGLVLGTSAVAATVVLTGFMAGLGAGAALGAAAAPRLGRPMLVYGALELAIGGAALSVPFAIGALEAAPPGLARVLGTLLIALPAVAMGATFPIVCAAGRRAPRAEALYGINTLGATLGTIATAYALLPALGQAATNLAAAAGSALAGAGGVALGLARRAPPPADPRLSSMDEDPPAIPFPAAAAAALVAGFAGLLLEVAWSRVFAMVLGGSVFAFASVLAAFLAGIGAGGIAAGSILLRTLPSAARLVAAGALALAGAAAFGGLFAAPELPYVFVRAHRALGAHPALEGALAAAVLLLPAVGLGAAFGALVRAAGGEARAAGALYALNTLGCIVGAAAGGLLIVPALGVAGAIALAAAALALAAGLATVRGAIVAAALVAGGAGFALRPALSPSVLATGAFGYLRTLPADLTRAQFFSQFEPGKVDLVFAKDGLVSTVTVERFPLANTVYLKNNGKVDGSAPIDGERPSRADMVTQVALAAAPLAIHGEAKSALVIGLGGGVTAGAALAFSIERLDIVEIEAEVVRALRETRDFDAWNGRPLDDPRARVHVEDARFFLREAAAGAYDAIISQPAEPWLTGVANLFTREFFALGRRALRDDGIFCQWVQLYGMDEEGLGILLATFREAFPETLVVWPAHAREILLLGRARPFSIDAERVAARLAEPAIATFIARAGLAGPDDFLGQVAAGSEDVEAFAGGRARNTDDSGAIELRAPRTRFVAEDVTRAAVERLAGAPRGLVRAFARPSTERVAAIAAGAARIGRFAAAEAWVRSLGDDASVRVLLGDLALRRGDRARALLEWNEALKREPRNQQALERIVRLRAMLEGEGR